MAVRAAVARHVLWLTFQREGACLRTASRSFSSSADVPRYLGSHHRKPVNDFYADFARDLDKGKVAGSSFNEEVDPDSDSLESPRERRKREARSKREGQRCQESSSARPRADATRRGSDSASRRFSRKDKPRTPADPDAYGLTSLLQQLERPLPSNSWDGTTTREDPPPSTPQRLDDIDDFPFHYEQESFKRHRREDLDEFTSGDLEPWRDYGEAGESLETHHGRRVPRWEKVVFDKQPRPNPRPAYGFGLRRPPAQADEKWPARPGVSLETRESLPPWSRRRLMVDPELTIKELLRMPPAQLPNRIDIFLEALPVPTTVAAMNGELADLRELIDHISPKDWGNLSAYRQAALLQLWSRWLDTAGRLNDLGGLPRMRGWEGREFAAHKFNSLFLTILGGKTRPGKGENWRKWRERFMIDETMPEEPEQDLEAPVDEATQAIARGESPEGLNGPQTHYTPPTLYKDSSVATHIEFDQALTSATKQRMQALRDLRKRRARESLKAVKATVAFMGTVQARPTDAQLKLIFTNLMDNISLPTLVRSIAEEDNNGHMREVLARLQPLLRPWLVVGPDLAEDADPMVDVAKFDSDNFVPAWGQGQRILPQRKELLMTVSDHVMVQMEQAQDPQTRKRWEEAANSLLPVWRFMPEKYEGLYKQSLSEGTPLRVPTVKEAHALHLLSRYTIAQLPPTAMRHSDMQFAKGTLGDPMYCLRLLLGVGDGKVITRHEGVHAVRPPETDKRIESVAIRWVRASVQRGLLSPVMTLLRILGIKSTRTGQAHRNFHPPSTALRTAVYLASAMHHPEDVPRILPLLNKIAVKPDPDLARLIDTAGYRYGEELKLGHMGVDRHGPHADLVRVIKLARKADRMYLEGQIEVDEGRVVREGDFERRLRMLFQSWGLPVMGWHGETFGEKLTDRTEVKESEKPKVKKSKFWVPPEWMRNEEKKVGFVSPYPRRSWEQPGDPPEPKPKVARRGVRKGYGLR